MIFTQAKRYQLTLWTSKDRDGLAIRFEFDNLDEAKRAFDENAAERRYAAGLLYEWLKVPQEWVLLSQYPE